MLEIKVLNDVELLLDTDSGEASFSYSGYAKCVGIAESTIRTRLNKRDGEGKNLKKSKKFNNRKLIPTDLALKYMLKDNPDKILKVAEVICNITGKLPNIDKIDGEIEELKKPEKKSLEGFIYVFESESKVLKVGFSRNIESRLKTLSRWENELILLTYVKSSINNEQKLHRVLHATGDFLGYEWYPISRKAEILEILPKYKSRSKKI
jgi:hypothetical protein